MKTNIFKSSLMAVAMAALFSACTQDELGNEAVTSEDALNVVAYSNDFISSDAESRVTNTGYATTFDEGDEIGVFIVRDGQALVSNMKMTLGDDEAWKGEGDAPLYYYKDADYIAYYPYTSGLSASSESDITSYFTEKVGTAGQATEAEYKAADMMSAEVKAADVVRGGEITFNLAHKMSMIEVKVPVRSYTTNSGNFTYKAPLGLVVNAGEDELALCCVGSDQESSKDIYRCIIAPSETAIEVDGQFQDGATEVYFPQDGSKIDVTPLAGQYKGININYTYTGATGSRDLKAGDYYYADGSIYPGELGNAPKVGCIGIIFSTTVNEQALKDKSFDHGYVVALENALHQTDAATTKDNLGNYYKWTNSAANIWDIVSEKSEVLTTENGYERTYTDEKASSCYAAQIAKNFGSHADQTKYLNPANTSGWFLPSSGLMDDLFHNLSGTTGLWDATNGFGEGSEQSEKLAALKTIQPKFTSVGGKFLGNGDISSYDVNTKDSPNTDRWWTSTDASVKDGSEFRAWSMEFKFNGQSKFLERNVTAANASVRPVFAF